jgi:beta-mannosidase
VTHNAENFRIDYSFEGVTHLTQVMQADAMGFAYSGWRRRLGKQDERGCGGVLVWQLNDSNPRIS